ncbi:type II toxin-antitoxin system HicB family antitoxin (plasmid) [Pyramidobacter sp. YE332]|uniref:type II toxin-antitoxin system HicB family antitoxin n=1 Tax=Pyramidobacter sp. YE332 TaxID=3068894 RepID=UPI00294ACC7E|nr:type II toxin-antitoxin system HicB family antitoxin [Pyramidobacter sp. YE332]WOL39600.1 type II toxin-antitoxin system HicB family antitoxin [Pyramidobacter sp. YE332]WOL41339.1 type II toxin-antitoxin system HicB family antitoxin [Pyramidobacter sp. YE332]
MVSSYPAVFVKETDGRYSVIFPDLNGASTCGDTLDDAMTMAIDCLAGVLSAMFEDGDTPPAPSALGDVSPRDVASELDDDYQDAFATLVAVDVREYAARHFNRAVRKTVTIPKWMNDTAIARGINFSQTLQNALRSEFNRT